MKEATVIGVRCDSCRWWVRSDKTVLLGECRGRAPIFADNLQDPRAWPYTRRDEWCGDYTTTRAQGGSGG